jgi:hypothetical protein
MARGMPQTTQPSVPTLTKWLKLYYTWIPQMIEEERIQEKWGREVAKGLKHSITALENSKKQWMREKRITAEENYNGAKQYFEG